MIFQLLLVPRHGSENNEGKSVGYIFLGSTPAGIFSLSDSCRIGVKEALETLKSMGIKTAMLTGDCQAAANYAQNQVKTKLRIRNMVIYFRVCKMERAGKCHLGQTGQKSSKFFY